MFANKMSLIVNRCLRQYYLIRRCFTSDGFATPNTTVKNNSFEHLYALDHEKLVYKYMEIQRKLDSYHSKFHPKNFDGRDKIRIAMPDVSEVIRTRFNMRKVAFKVAYTGWDYLSYYYDYASPKSGNYNSIERVFLEALLRQQLITTIYSKNRLISCGRTDQNVSGFSQVIVANVRTNLDKGYGIKNFIDEENKNKDEELFNISDESLDENELNYIKLLNEALPVDIRVYAWSPVSRKFSPRFDCKMRTYQYHFYRGDFDVELMDKAAKKFLGTNDFRNFCTKSRENVFKTMERTFYEFNVEVIDTDEVNSQYDLCVATIRASSFLYNQIRKMMSVLFAVGYGKEEPEIIDRMLDIEVTSGFPKYTKVLAEKLVLSETFFDPSEVHWRYDLEDLEQTIEIMAKRYDTVSTRAEILKQMTLHLSNQTEKEMKTISSTSLSQSIFLKQTINKDWISFDEDSRSLDDAQTSAKNTAVKKALSRGQYRLAVSLTEEQNE